MKLGELVADVMELRQRALIAGEKYTKVLIPFSRLIDLRKLEDELAYIGTKEEGEPITRLLGFEVIVTLAVNEVTLI